jgi:hypothetical protein
MDSYVLNSHTMAVTMAFEGGVIDIDICTVAFDTSQLDVVVPGTLDRVQQLLNEERGRDDRSSHRM